MEVNLKLLYFYKVYSNFNFKDVLDFEKFVLINENSLLIIFKEFFVSMVMFWCGVESDYIKINGKEMFFVCFICLMNYLYNFIVYVCQKCLLGIFVVNRVKLCIQKNGIGLMLLKFLCDIKCIKGKWMDGDFGMCEWCLFNIYQNFFIKINLDCMFCFGEKKILFLGVLDVEECCELCLSGIFFNVLGSICQNCLVGFYMDVDGYIIV